MVVEGAAGDEKESLHVLERWGLKQQISLSQVNQLSQPYSRLFAQTSEFCRVETRLYVSDAWEYRHPRTRRTR